ncbi:MAG: ATP-binding cassette domain-containing protein, partial [Elusimicrobia bacterium]|nr:ATP-binding cassette domain-containing protein [Elusimicrobiota bacterium]
RKIQFMFQDSYSSLDPRMRAGTILREPLVVQGIGNGAEQRKKVLEMLDHVGLPATAVDRYPHEFSGGQRQRVGLARALVLHPKLVIADEPVSALDVSIRAQVVNLMMRLKERFRLTYVFVAHDLSIVEYISTHVAVMYLGHVMEKATSRALYSEPKHPYTQALIAANPVPDPRRRSEKPVLKGEIPSPLKPPLGCVFHTRCPLAEARCRVEVPALRNTAKAGADEHLVACHLVKEAA